MSTMNSIIAIIISLLSLPALYLLLTTIAAYLFKKKRKCAEQLPQYRRAHPGP